ncbi:MAG: transposase, partial [Bacteroidales bacterium]|nr:transposase [Bacteroidales bacterium]
MEARHAYIKGLRGNGIFYRSEDFIVLITIVSVLVKKGGVKVMAFCPMFNHIHFLIKNISLYDLRRFIQRLAIIFVKEYNNEYGRKGTVFQKPFGCSLKRTIKIIMGCVAYVFNNPVAAKLSRAAREYRWSLYAYHNNKNPYSEPLKKETCRNKMRVALKKVDYFHAKGQYLSYAALRDIFEYLDEKERL